MSHGLSIEVILPEGLHPNVVISIGERYCDYMEDGPLTLDEALQYAFIDPDGIVELSRMGVQWTVISTGKEST